MNRPVYDDLSHARLDANLRDVVAQAMKDWDAAPPELRAAALQAARQLAEAADARCGYGRARAAAVGAAGLCAACDQLSDALGESDAPALDNEREMMHERAHAGVSDPDACDRGPFCPGTVWRVRTTEDGFPCLVITRERRKVTAYEIDPAVFYDRREPNEYGHGQWRRAWNTVLLPPARAIR